MKRVLALVAIFLVLSIALLPGPAWAGGGWHHGHRGGHGGWGGPGALIGGPALRAVAIAAAPLWAFPPPPPPGGPAPPARYVPPTPGYAAAPPHAPPPPDSGPP